MRKQAPDNNQTAKQVESYYRSVKPGDVAVIRCTQGNVLRYLLDKVTETNPKKGRVYVEKGDAWGGQGYYAKSGKSTDTPTGQTNLVVPTEEVLVWIKDNPDMIQSAVMTYEVDYNIIPPGQRNDRLGFGLTRTRDVVLKMTQKRNMKDG
jgi:hypothetical protein